MGDTAGTGVGAAGTDGAWTDETATEAVGLGVIGIEHLHVFEMVDGLVAAGAAAVAHASAGDSLADHYAGWQTASRSLTPAEVIAEEQVGLVVLAGVPSERPALAVAAMEAGKDVLSAKPGAVDTSQLRDIRAAAQRSGRRWWVMFSERLANPAVLGAVRAARSGAIGRVVHVAGVAPHRLAADGRPEWFFDSARAGGILVDLGSHQVDQFLAITGAEPDGVEVLAAAAGSVGPGGTGSASTGIDEPRPGGTGAAFDDIGELLLAAPGVRGHHRVDWLEADGFPGWGDVRLVVTGTDGRIEVRIPVLDGSAGPAELRITDHAGVRVVDDLPSPTWAADLLADHADRGERLMSTDHPFDVTEITLRAAAVADPWSAPRLTGSEW